MARNPAEVLPPSRDPHHHFRICDGTDLTDRQQRPAALAPHTRHVDSAWRSLIIAPRAMDFNPPLVLGVLFTDHLIECLQQVSSTPESLTVMQARNGLVTSVGDASLTLWGFETEEQPYLCPKLFTLWLDSCISCADGACADMFESRMRSPTPWKRFDVTFRKDKNLSDHRRLQAIQDGG